MIQDTIRSLFAAGNIDGIIHQVETLLEDRKRVRLENEGFKHEIRRLAQAFANITEPATGRPITEKPERPERPVRSTDAQTLVRTMNTPKPSKPSKEALDLDL